MQVNQSWNYKESLYYIEYIKRDYEYIMLSFSVFGGNNEVIQKIRQIKKDIYNLDFEEWKKDKLWEFMNNDVTYNELWSFI